jgi:hypothetical protein
MAQSKRGYQTIKLELREGETLSVYTSARIADAMKEITANASLYEGVRLTQILEAMYKQGLKDGRREAFDQLDRRLAEAKRQLPHRRPGRPRRTRR